MTLDTLQQTIEAAFEKRLKKIAKLAPEEAKKP